MKYITYIIIFFTILSCTKDKIEPSSIFLNKQITLDPWNKEGLPLIIDLNRDGIIDVEITGERSFSGSSGSEVGLNIQGLNGSTICFQTKQETRWILDVFTGTMDTLVVNDTFKQPTPFNLGDEINNQFNSTDSLLCIFYERYPGSMSIPSSPVIRTDLINGDYKYFVVITPGGLYWIKVNPGLPITIIQSCSGIGATSGLIIN